MCYYNMKFSMATDFFGIFYHMKSFKSINIVFEASTTVYLVPYPRIEEQILILPSQIQVPVPSAQCPNDAFDTDNVNNFKSYTFR